MLEWIQQKFSKEHSGGLQPLTPEIHAEEHKYYVDELGRAINNDSIHTIALMGGYGSGKSSIIKQLSDAKIKSGRLLFKHKLRIKTISFFSMSSETLKDKYEKSEQTKIDFLKSEILRQLFYQTKPAKVPRIQYNTLENRLPKKVVVPVSIILAIASVLLLPIASLLRLIFCDLSPEINFCETVEQNIAPIICKTMLLGIICIFYYYVLQTFYKVINKYSLKGMGGKVYSLEFIAKSKNFDEFIDGLVYLISKCKYDILIFEDIDRCDDAEIYYELRQLNLAINGRLRKKIKFLFALRDDLIEGLDNRTKLFDMVITVIPFLSPENSIEFIETQLSRAGYEPKHIHGIAKIIGRHITDGRSIISICNTARIMKRQLQKSAGWLDDAKIIAMALIRETNPKDFLGLYNHTGAISNIFSLCQKARALAITALPGQCSAINIIRKEQEQFKDKLLSHPQTSLHGFSSLVFMGQTYEVSPDDCVELLIAVAQYIASDSYLPDMQISIPPYNYTVSAVEFFNLLPSSERVLYLLEKGEKAVLEEERQQLLQKDTFTWNKDVKISGEVPSKLIFELIELGYLDESYHLYMAPFKQTSASLRVENFKFNNLKVGTSDYYAIFTEIEIRDLLGDLDSVELRTNALYNCSIFNYLAQNNKIDVAKKIINVDSAQWDNLFEFYSLYFQQHQLEMEAIKERAVSDAVKENHALWLLSILASTHPEATIEYILNDNSLSLMNKSVMMSVALLYLGKPAIEVSLRDAEDLNGLQCDVIITAGLGIELVKLFQANNVAIYNIEPFINSPDIMEYILKSGRVDINAKNLQYLQDSQILQYISRSDACVKGSDLMELLNMSSTSNAIIDYIMHHLTNYDIKKDDKILWEKIGSILNTHHISFSFEEIDNINDAPVSVLIAMMAWSQLEKNQVLSLFRKMDEDSGWKKLSVPKSRPTIKDNGIATKQMVTYLRTIGIVSSFKYQEGSYKVICQDFDPISNP